MLTKQQEHDYLQWLWTEAQDLTFAIHLEPEAESVADGLEMIVQERLAILDERARKADKEEDKKMAAMAHYMADPEGNADFNSAD